MCEPVGVGSSGELESIVDPAPLHLVEDECAGTVGTLEEGPLVVCDDGIEVPGMGSESSVEEPGGVMPVDVP